MSKEIIENLFQAQKNVSFFLRLHRHLPDNICGESPISPCEYREDGCAINELNDYIDKLKENPEFLRKEEEVVEAQKNGKRLRLNPPTKKN